MIELDGTPNKGRLGANAILAVSMAAARAAAASQTTPLYRYLGGVGAHAAARPDDEHPQRRRARRQLRGRAGVHDRALRRAEVRRSAAHGRRSLPHPQGACSKKRGYSTAVGDEGGFAPNLKSNEEALEVVLEAIAKAGYKPGEQIGICLDPAASEFFDRTASTSSRSPTRASARSEQMVEFWANWVRQYPIISIEDGMAEDDWDGWKLLTDALGDEDPARGRRPVRHQHASAWSAASSEGVANSILIKVNQIGTLTETLDAMQMAASAGYTAVVSHRSGETEDAFIADLVVATNAGPDQDRLGQPHRPHRQVQPVAAHRGGTRRGGAVRRAERRSATNAASKAPRYLTILDGWGLFPGRRRQRHRRGAQAHLRQAAARVPEHADSHLGPLVGLPEGQMGNSEVGHLNIGAGRVDPHGHYPHRSDDRDRAISYSNPVLLDGMRHARSGHRLHFMGLCSHGGVHSQLTHLYALLQDGEARGRRTMSAYTASWTGATRRPTAASSTCEQLQQQIARDRRGPHRHRDRPLLRDGPRQAVGARGARLRRHGAGQWREGHRSRRGHPASPTNRA